MCAFPNFLVLSVTSVLLFSCNHGTKQKKVASAGFDVSWEGNQAGHYSVELAYVKITVDLQAGGRITTLAIDDANLLTGPDIDSINYGSTLWLSPQNLWRWPPPSVLDRQPYQLIAKSDSLFIKSSVDNRFGVSFSKSFLPSLKDTSLQITYSIHNRTDSVVTYALWEVTRMQKDSEVMFTLEEQNSLRSIKESFWDQDSNRVKVSVSPTDILTNKMFANGKGWLIYQKDSLALIKTFPDLSLDQLPPNHNEIEIYKDDTAYLEVEQHSPYVQLDPKETYQWQVKWYPRKFSNGQEIEKWMDAL